jgi:phosphohistidine phosphatase
MRLYLVRHGEARPGEEDPAKRLSAKGLADVMKVAALLRPRGLAVEAIWHSGKTRAAETADILADAVKSRQGALRWPGLEPNDPVAPIINDLVRVEGDLMIVGHLPFLGRLASRLMAGDEAAVHVAFRTATALCLERDPQRGWCLVWMLPPDVV